ncbi:MAG: DUF1467 family protein [Xanthobacteraceae bacterium]
MAWTTIAGFYIVLWWIVLFAVLPFGTRSQEESGEIVPGSEPGAPVAPNLIAKIAWTTVITTVIFVLIYMAFALDLIDLERFQTMFGLFPR